MLREISGSTKSVPLPLFLSIYTDDYVYMCEFSYWANESVFRWMWMGGWKPLLLIRRLVKALLEPTKVPPVHSSVFCPSQIFSFHLLLIFWGVWGVGGRPCGLDWFQGFDFNTSDLMIRTKPRVLDWTRYSFSFCFSESPLHDFFLDQWQWAQKWFELMRWLEDFYALLLWIISRKIWTFYFLHLIVEFISRKIRISDNSKLTEIS